MRVTSLRPRRGPGVPELSVAARRLSVVKVGVWMTTSPKLPCTRTLSCEATKARSSAKVRASSSSPLPGRGAWARAASVVASSPSERIRPSLVRSVQREDDRHLDEYAHGPTVDACGTEHGLEHVVLHAPVEARVGALQDREAVRLGAAHRVD